MKSDNQYFKCNKMKQIYLIVGMVFWASLGFAQPLSVEQYRAKVLEYNQDIQKSQQAVDGALFSLKSFTGH